MFTVPVFPSATEAFEMETVGVVAACAGLACSPTTAHTRAQTIVTSTYRRSVTAEPIPNMSHLSRCRGSSLVGRRPPSLDGLFVVDGRPSIESVVGGHWSEASV